MVVFQSCRSSASVPSWTLLYDGPVALLCEYPTRKLTRDCGSSMRSTSLMRRAVSNRWGELSAGIYGVEVGGLRGLASKSKSEKFRSRRKLPVKLYHLPLSARIRKEIGRAHV